MSQVDEPVREKDKQPIIKMVSSANNQFLIRKNKLEKKLTRTFQRLTYKHEAIPSRHILICEDAEGILKCYFNCEKTIHDDLPKPFIWNASNADKNKKDKNHKDTKNPPQKTENEKDKDENREQQYEKKKTIIKKKKTFFRGSGSDSSSQSSSSYSSSPSASDQENSCSDSDSRSGSFSSSSFHSDEDSCSDNENESQKKQSNNDKIIKHPHGLKGDFKEDILESNGGISIPSKSTIPKKLDKNIIVPISSNHHQLGKIGRGGVTPHTKTEPERSSDDGEGKVLISLTKQVSTRELIEFSPSVFLKKSQSNADEARKATNEKYGDFLELIEEITIEHCFSTNIFADFNLPNSIQILRVNNSVFDILPTKEYIHECRKTIEHVHFIQAIPVSFRSSVFSFITKCKQATLHQKTIDIKQRDKAVFILFQQDILKIQYLDQIKVVIFDLLDPKSSQEHYQKKNNNPYNPLMRIDYQQLINNHYQLRKEHQEKKLDIDSKRSTENKKDLYLESLEEGSPEFYNYLFLDMKEEGRMDEEELQLFEISKFNEALETLEKDLERRMQFENYVIGRLQTKKHKKNKKKLRIELIINKFHFEDIPSFVYLTNAIDLYSSKISTIKFMRLGRIKDNLFNILMTKIRDMKRVKILLFYDTALYPQHLEEIKAFMNWKKNSLQKIGFVKNYLNPLDLNFLFDTKESKYPHSHEQLNRIHSLENFNDSLAKSYRVIMVKYNFISKTLRRLITEHSKPISKAGIYYNGNLGYDFNLKDGWDSNDWNEENAQIIEQAIENDQLQKFEASVYAENFAKFERTRIIEMETHVFSKKSFTNIGISVGFIDPKRIENVLSTRLKIGIMNLNIIEDLDEDIKNLNVKDLIVSHLECVSLYPVEKGYIYPRTLRSIELNVESEDKNIAPGLNACGPYLENFILTGPYEVHKNNFPFFLKSVQWDRMVNLRRLALIEVYFLDGQLADLIKQLQGPSLRELLLTRLTTSRDTIMSPDWSAFTGLQQISFSAISFVGPADSNFTLSTPFEALAHQLTNIDIQRLPLNGEEYGSYTPSKYKQLRQIQFIVSNSRINKNENLGHQIKKLKEIAQENKRKKDEKGIVHTINEEEEEDDEEIKAREEQEEKNSRISHERRELEEGENEIDDGTDKRVKELYSMRQKGIINAGVQKMQEQVYLEYSQSELSNQVKFISFDRIKLILKNASIFSESGIPSDFDFSLIANNITSIDISFLSQSEECRKIIQKNCTRKLFQKVNEIRIRDHIDSNCEPNQKLCVLVSDFLPALTFLDLRGSVIELSTWFNPDQNLNSFRIETLKVSYSFFKSGSTVKAFFSKIASTLKYLEVDTCSYPETISDQFDFSVLKVLTTFIFYAEITNASIQSFLTLPESLEILVLGEEENIKRIIQKLLMKPFPNLKKLSLSLVEQCYELVEISNPEEQLFSNNKNSSLKELFLKSLNLTIEQLTNTISFQSLKNLSALDLSHNPLIQNQTVNLLNYSRDTFPIESDSYASIGSEMNSRYNSELDLSSQISGSDEEEQETKEKKQTHQVTLLPNSQDLFSKLLNPIINSLKILILKNCQIRQSIFSNVLLSNSSLSKLDISSNPRFFEDDSASFISFIQSISTTLTDLNMSSTNLNIERHFKNIRLGKQLMKLDLLKIKSTPSLTLSKDGLPCSNACLEFFFDILNNVSHLTINELPVGLDFRQAKHLTSLNLSQLRKSKYNKNNTTGIQEIVEQLGNQLINLNLSFSYISEADILATNWKALSKLKKFDLSRISTIQSNIQLVKIILDPLLTIEELKICYDNMEVQFMLMEWDKFTHLTSMIVTDQVYEIIFEYNQNMSVWKGNLSSPYKYAAHPLQLLNKTIDDLHLDQNSVISQFQNQNRPNIVNELVLSEYYYKLEGESISQHENFTNPNKTISFYSLIAWNIIRLDFIKKQEGLIQFQNCLFEELTEKRMPLIYFNNINVYLFFAFSQQSEKGFLDLVLSDQFLERESTDVIIVQSKNLEQLFYFGTSDESLVSRLMEIKKKFSIQRVILTYSIFSNRNRLMNQLAQSKSKEDVYDLYSENDAHIAESTSKKALSKSEIESNSLFRIDEGKMLEFFNFSPPETLELSNYSVQFLKYLFLILVYAPYSFSSKINYMLDSLPNSSISARLMKGCYSNGNNGYLYKFLRFFYTDPQFYKFDQSVIQFNMQLKNRKQNTSLKVMLQVMIPVYYAICIFCPIYFTYYFNLIDSCGSGLSWVSYYIYGFFAVISLWMEYKLYIQVIDSVSHLIPPAAIPPPTSTLNLLLIQFKKLSNQHRKLLYIFSFVNSQISRYNYFTDIGFIVGSYQCGQMGIMTASIVCVGLHTIINLVKYISSFTRKKKKFLIPTSEIDDFCNLSSLIEFHAVYEVLDLISPSNIIVLPVFLRHVRIFKINHLAGVAFNSRIIDAFTRFLIIFLTKEKTINITIILSLCATILTIFIQLYKFLSIRPSPVSSLDFEDLNNRKKDQFSKFLRKTAQLSKSIDKRLINQFQDLSQKNPAIFNEFLSFKDSPISK